MTIIERIERLARISAYPWNLTRRIFSPAQAEAEALVLGWMQEAGLSTRRDPHRQSHRPGGGIDPGWSGRRHRRAHRHAHGCQPLRRHARPPDGPRGRRGRDPRGLTPRHAIEVVAFVTDAAGRFGLPRPGSRALSDGSIRTRWAGRRLRRHPARSPAIAGARPRDASGARRSADEIVAYLEIAAEAGPVLEWSGAPVGIVPALSASSILRVTLTGQAVGAATVPMSADARRPFGPGGMHPRSRADRIRAGRRHGHGRARRRRIRVDFRGLPGATFGVCILSCDDAARSAAVNDLVAAFEGIAARRQLEIAIEKGIDPDATRCEPGIVRLFERAVEAAGHPLVRLRKVSPPTPGIWPCWDDRLGAHPMPWRRRVGPAGDVEPADVEIGLNVLTSVLGTLASGTNAPPYP